MAHSMLIQGSMVRGLYGLLALIAPEVLIAGVPGMSEDEFDDDARYFNRLFGGRDLLVAVATVTATQRPGAQRAAVVANVLCEVTDSVALAAELRKRGGLDTTTVVGALFNVAGYATWLRAAGALRRSRSARTEIVAT